MRQEKGGFIVSSSLASFAHPIRYIVTSQLASRLDIGVRVPAAKRTTTIHFEDDMIEPATVEVQPILQRGRIAAIAGDTHSARTLFRRAAELDPACAEAWLGLSGVVPVLAEKRDCLQRVLALDPDNAEAQAGLRYVEQLLAGGLRIAPAQRDRRSVTSEAASTSVAADSTPAIEHCYNHPDRETGLHCVQCAQPICGKCARMAPVGQLCPKCRRGRRPQQYKVTSANLLVAGGVALIVSALASALTQFVMGGFLGFYVAFFAGPLTAEIIIRITDRLTRAKRGRAMQIVVGAAMVAGMLPFALFNLPLLLGLLAEVPPEMALGLFQPNPMMLIFMGIGVATAAARLT